MNHHDLVEEALGALIMGGLLVANASGTARIVRSSEFSRSQKLMQTLFVWLLPGFFLLPLFFTRKAPDHSHFYDGFEDFEPSELDDVDTAPPGSDSTD